MTDRMAAHTGSLKSLEDAASHFARVNRVYNRELQKAQQLGKKLAIANPDILRQIDVARGRLKTMATVFAKAVDKS